MGKTRPLRTDYLRDTVEGCTPCEIARRHGVAVGTVQQWMHRHRELVREVQEEYRNRLIDGLLLLHLGRAADALEVRERIIRPLTTNTSTGKPVQPEQATLQTLNTNTATDTDTAE